MFRPSVGESVYKDSRYKAGSTQSYVRGSVCLVANYKKPINRLAISLENRNGVRQEVNDMYQHAYTNVPAQQKVITSILKDCDVLELELALALTLA
jgi:hypothetical protein